MKTSLAPVPPRLPLPAVLTRAVRKSARRWADLGCLQFFVRSPAPAASASAFEGREIGQADIRAVAHDLGKDEEDFARRITSGRRCFAALSEGRAVHVRWTTEAPSVIPEIDRLLVPARGEAYVFDSFTRPAWRGRHAPIAARAAMDAAFLREGIGRTWFYVRSDNHASLQHLARESAEVFRALYLRPRDRAPWVLFRGARDEARTLLLPLPGPRPRTAERRPGYSISLRKLIRRCWTVPAGDEGAPESRSSMSSPPVVAARSKK